MFRVDIDCPSTGGLERGLIDSEFFDRAMKLYVDIAWEDPAHVLLSRTVIIRDAVLGDVWAVGIYSMDPVCHPDPPVLTFFRNGTVPCVFTFHRSGEKTRCRIHAMDIGMLMPC